MFKRIRRNNNFHFNFDPIINKIIIIKEAKEEVSFKIQLTTNDRIDYIINDARCELALEDYYNNVPESSWMLILNSFTASIKYLKNMGQYRAFVLGRNIQFQ